MKKIKKKLLHFVIFISLCVFGIGLYAYLSPKTEIDRSSYVKLLEGKGVHNKSPLFSDIRVKLNVGDSVVTADNSRALIEWGDGSVTRLGENTKIEIKENYVSNDNTTVQVIFQIFSGKTWSNVLSYIPGDSYFTQVYDDTEVAVRGTVFMLDMDKKYIYVDKHSVTLKKKDGVEYEVGEKRPFGINSLDVIPLKTYLSQFKDNLFFDFNKTNDKKLYTFLEETLKGEIKNIQLQFSKIISDLSGNNKDNMYNKALSIYQNVNFVSVIGGSALFDMKIQIKEELFKIANESEKYSLARSLYYDLKDSISSETYYALDRITKIILENKKYFDFGYFLEYISEFDIQKFIEISVRNDINMIRDGFSDSIKLFDEKIKIVTEKGEEIENNVIKQIKEDIDNATETFENISDEISKKDLEIRKKIAELKKKAGNSAKDVGQETGEVLSEIKKEGEKKLKEGVDFLDKLSEDTAKELSEKVKDSFSDFDVGSGRGLLDNLKPF